MIERNDGQQSQAANPRRQSVETGSGRSVEYGQLPLGQDALGRTMPRGGERRRDEQKKKSETTVQRPQATAVAAESEWSDGSQTAEPTAVTARRRRTGGTSRQRAAADSTTHRWPDSLRRTGGRRWAERSGAPIRGGEGLQDNQRPENVMRTR
ncbi:hypothetical protein GN244_ATG12661 [Phytophthora infestans]|uniref:Uncharacterized protein n=1 Tax=Phytophthora infestans TaxID=4787 RepID=A0A833SZF5_PHYIN|nr:hypothetical protein GN244_ATG12661 [Phytophthora infestans]